MAGRGSAGSRSRGAGGGNRRDDLSGSRRDDKSGSRRGDKSGSRHDDQSGSRRDDKSGSRRGQTGRKASGAGPMPHSDRPVAPEVKGGRRPGRVLAATTPAPSPAEATAATRSPRTGPRSGPRPPEGCYWLHGRHAVLAALANPARHCERLLAILPLDDALALAARQRGIGPEAADRMVLDRLTEGGVHQGVALAVAPLEEPALDELLDPPLAPEPSRRRCLLVLDQVTDPRNVGAILRSAAAFAAAGIVMQRRHAPEERAVLAKAASGALELVPVVREVNLARALDQIGNAGFQRIALVADATQSLAAVAAMVGRESPVALVLGAEDTGIRSLVRGRCDHVARLPMAGDMESLNVSVAAAIALYELSRD